MLSTVSLMANTPSALIVNDSLPNSVDQAKFEQIEKKLIRSPHYKNPNAAGRLAVFNRNAPAGAASTREMLSGPTYKNRKRVPVLADTTAAPKTTRRKLMGPRYKNRSAKSRHSQ